MNEENKEELEQEDIAEVDSLVNYYVSRKVDPLPAIKQAIIRQNVAFSYEWFVNMHMRIDTPEAWAFSTYRCLIQALPEYYGNYIEIMRDEFHVNEETIEKCLRHIRSGLIPYQIWIDKVIADIKGGGDYYGIQTVPSIVFVYLLKTMRTSIIGYMKLYKALLDEENGISEEVKNMVFAAHIYFSEMPMELKQEYMEAFASEDPVIQRAFQDNELSLFSETLIDMLRNPLNLEKYIAIEKGDAPTFSKFWEEPLNMAAPLINKSRGQEVADSAAEERTKAGLPRQKGGMGSFAQDVLGYGPNGESPEEMKRKIAELAGNVDVAQSGEIMEEEPPEDAKYVVEKVAKDSSSRVMSRSSFNSKPEAEQFIKNVSDAAPDMLKSFEFQIWEESGGHRRRVK